MTQFTPLKLVTALLLILASSQVFAGHIFRYQDESGVTTMSKFLPPQAAQNGYDVLDDKTLRLIERVEPALTAEQIIEEEKRIAAEKEAQRLAEKEQQQQQEQLRQQAISDNNLRASYGSEQDLINARDTEITYLNNLLDKTKAHKDKSQTRLGLLQNNAAEAELSGKKISVNQQKRIDAAQQEINNAEMEINRLENEISQRSQQFDKDLARLRELFADSTNPTKP